MGTPSLAALAPPPYPLLYPNTCSYTMFDQKGICKGVLKPHVISVICINKCRLLTHLA